MTDEARQRGDEEHKADAAIQAANTSPALNTDAIAETGNHTSQEQAPTDSDNAQDKGKTLDSGSPEAVEVGTAPVAEHSSQRPEIGEPRTPRAGNDGEGQDEEHGSVTAKEGDNHGEKVGDEVEEEEGDDENDDEEEEDDAEDEEDEDEEEDDDEDDEPRLKYARLTPQLNSVYRNGDATSTFLVAGDKMVSTASQR